MDNYFEKNVDILFFGVKDPFKKHVGNNSFFTRLWFCDHEQLIIYAICGKCLLQAFGFTLVSLSCLPF
jgi:hypothetical protein